jgi:hypothetical protein
LRAPFIQRQIIISESQTFCKEIAEKSFIFSKIPADAYGVGLWLTGVMAATNPGFSLDNMS